LEHIKNIVNLEKISIDDEILLLVAQNAEGSVRDALSLLDKVLTLGSGASLQDSRQLLGLTDEALCAGLVQAIANKSEVEIPKFFQELSETGVDYTIFNRDLLEFLRKVLISKIAGGDFSESVRNLSKAFSVNEIIFIVRLFLKSYKDLASTPSPEIPLLLASVEAASRRIGGIRAIGESEQSVVKTSEADKVSSLVNIKPPIVKTQQPEPKEIIEETSVITFEEAVTLWPNIIAKIKAINGPLASMLKNTQLTEVYMGKLVVSVKFKFDKQSLETAKNYDVICKAIKEVSGKNLGLEARVAKVEAVSSANPAEVLADALKVFGGELIE
jgi:DNA polymerase-3 subunit gamma/tau